MMFKVSENTSDKLNGNVSFHDTVPEDKPQPLYEHFNEEMLFFFCAIVQNEALSLVSRS